MATHNWKDIKKGRDVPVERRATIAAETARIIGLEMSLAEVRKMLGFSQDALADEANMRQASISAMESGQDALLSSVRKYVEGLGGRLDVVATFGDKSIKLQGV